MFQQAKKFTAAVAVLGAAALGGATFANATTDSTTSTTSSSAASAPARPAFTGPAHGTAAHESAESAYTGSQLAAVKAAALKAAGGGTVTAVTTDYSKSGYEVEITKADGSTTEIHLDSSLQALQGHGGPGDAAADAAGASSTSGA